METYRIPEMANKYINYDMIQNYTELPDFPDSRVRLLYAFLANECKNKKHSELYALAVALIQMGLDTHDLIDTDTGQKQEKAMRSRQLKVLAGDYFSSRFYHLLSQESQIDLIKKLSGAICEVNRLKMNLYMKMKLLRVTAEEYIQTCVKLKTELFDVFSGMLEEKNGLQWPALMQGFSQCEVVAGELKRIETAEQFKGSWGYWHVLQEGTEEEKRMLKEDAHEDSLTHDLVAKYDIRNHLAAQLRQAVDHVQSAARKLESDKLVQELCQIGESFLRTLPSIAPAYNEMR
ncbi:heptaprenyl diphosphate synthase component 1 [Paenibacillus sp. GCM10012307]|uniref:Heptaprenyl diphosphate synthase component 1 n=1 Tax=Paenibacillus roseus TaxID=2798579 RepID=A0A934J585_9BACL|nr:heptaprenyl diphosphate synthase component 1 [Paenibacillus roseus]MBJ6363524.1 heptaprenyl diphosphate synthase component 1 [Paenibacillus roseus]